MGKSERFVVTMERLLGPNRVEEFRKIAELLRSRIVACGGVSGIVYMGGLVRGFADRHSDVDIIILLSERDESLRKKIKKIGADERKRSGVDVDLEVHFLQDFKTWKWNEMARWDFSHSEIIFDAEGKVRKLIAKRLRVRQSFWLKRIVVYGEYIKWYCCQPQDNVGTIAETWVDRGDMVSAHYCLDYALDLLIRIVYALNKEFLPPPKWEIFYSSTLKWLPSNYGRLVADILTVKSLSKRELDRRLGAARELWREILPKIREETGLTPDLISRQYAKHILSQG